MLPLELIRKDPDRVRRAAELKGEPAPIDEILALDKEWRRHLHEAETIKAEQNELSKEFAKTRDEELKVRLREMAERSKAELAEAEAVKRQLDDLLLRVPNLFDESVPVGEGEQDNVVLREWGSKVALGFPARTHYDLGETLGIMDFDRRLDDRNREPAQVRRGSVQSRGPRPVADPDLRSAFDELAS